MSTSSDVAEPVDPDLIRLPRRILRRSGTLAVVSLGGGFGALARYGASAVFPSGVGQFPWGAFLVNVLGSLLIGVLMVLVTDVWVAHRLVRPFLGVGVLGGFTTLSTYAVEGERLLRTGAVGVAFVYLLGTVLCALLAVLIGVGVTRWFTGVARR